MPTIWFSIENDFDIIFAGGGTTACITAGRLAAADPSLKILIIEDGPETRNKPVHIQPARCFANVIGDPASGILHVFPGRVSDALGGRAPIVSAGRCLGGGSAVNMLMYTRAAASDYDDWEKTFKNPGWGSEDLIPLLQKAETYFDRTVPYHGHKGPIKVSYREDQINVAEQFLDVAERYDKERTLTKDVNGFFSCNAYGRLPQYVDPETGRRSDTAHYLYDQIEVNENIQVYCGERVLRVLFEGTRAVGVEYTNGPGGEVSIAKASRLVVLSAGAFGSPTILQRSGIGSDDLLKKNGIKQVVDLPGVGEHYMDHVRASASYHASDDADTLDLLMRGGEEAMKPFVEQWSKTGKGLLAHNAVDAGIKIRPNREDLQELGEAFESRWRIFFAPAPDKPIALMALLAGFRPPRPIPVEPTTKILTPFYFITYPISVGLVRITSGTNAYAPLDFHPGYLESPADLAVMRLGYKKGREILRRMKSYRGEYSLVHPKFPAGSLAEAKCSEGPVEISAPDITYSKEDDEAIDQFHRETASTMFHSTGTCAMKPRKEGGVVDSRLNVYGTQCLKVADCSIAPGNVGGNTYNTALAIGEKAAILIAEELGIQGV